MNLNRLFNIACALSSITFFAASGCARLVLVESRLIEPKVLGEAEVTTTHQYLDASARLKRVALRAPDTCTSLGAAETTGVAQKTGTIVATECGVEMAELERALTQAGYIVSSWRVLANDMATHGISATDAAQKLGAEVLFQVNSLERVKTPRGEGAHWERTFYRSNMCGDALRPVNLDERDLADLRLSSAEREGTRLRGEERLGATLNVNAIMVETSQTFWFYQWTKFNVSAGLELGVLSQLTLMGPVVVTPQCSSDQVARPTIGKSTESAASNVGLPSSSEEKALYFKLVREVVNDFVTQFAKGAAPSVEQRAE